MKYFEWDEAKNQKLMAERGISFEIVVECIKNKLVVEKIKNHHPYEHQSVFLIYFEEHIYRVPFVEDEEKVFLKTVYRSRSDTKKYKLSNKIT